MFKTDRIFSCFNLDSGLTDWFFNTREGICGAYRSKEEASKFLKDFSKKRMVECDDGGRSSPEPKLFSIIPKENSVDAIRYDSFKQKKGRE